MSVNTDEKKFEKSLLNTLSEPKVFDINTDYFSEACNELIRFINMKITHVTKITGSEDTYRRTQQCLTSKWLYICLHLIDRNKHPS